MDSFQGVSVSRLPEHIRSLFPYDSLNAVQSECFEAAFIQEDHLVVEAPTGSGKTGVLELALARELAQANSTGATVYLAPLKALIRERFDDWKCKLDGMGIKICELTGDDEDSDEQNFREVGSADLILTTPEKWDSFTRFRRNAQGIIGRLSLVLVDELHLLVDNERGPTLEAVLTRMKAISQSDQVRGCPVQNLRFVGVSATISNIEDISKWLGPHCVSKSFDSSFRPVHLTWNVLSFKMGLAFTYDKQVLIPQLLRIVQQYSNQRPALIFCNSRKSSSLAAANICENAGSMFVHSNPTLRRHLAQAAAQLDNKTLAEQVCLGVASYTAEMSLKDRQCVHSLFVQGAIAVLAATSGLAQGVNLPAHLVVIMNSSKYSHGGYVEYSRIEVMQMAGRAGRPQFDTSGCVVVMTRPEAAPYFHSILSGTEVIESSLNSALVAHLNAEIAFEGNYIYDIPTAVSWLKSTFLFQRMKKNPVRYKLPSTYSEQELEQAVSDMCMHNLRGLATAQLIEIKDDILLKPLLLGKIMAKHCVDFDTICKLPTLLQEGSKSVLELTESLLSFLSESSDLTSITYLRNDEKKRLFDINSSDQVRFVIRNGKKASKIKSSAMKVKLLLQLRLGGHAFCEFHAVEQILVQRGQRILRAIMEYAQALRLSSVLLAACLLQRSLTKGHGWHDEPAAQLRQLEGIGPALAERLVSSNVCDLASLVHKSAAHLETICGKAASSSTRILSQANIILAAGVRLAPELKPPVHPSQQASLSIGFLPLSTSSPRPPSQWLLVVGDSVGNLVLVRDKLQSSQITVRDVFTANVPASGSPFTAHLVNVSLMGLDQSCQISIPGAAGPSQRVPEAAPTETKSIDLLALTQEESTDSEEEAAAADARLLFGELPAMATGAKRPSVRHTEGGGACKHLCANKLECKHMCCKQGIKSKRRLPSESHLRAEPSLQRQAHQVALHNEDAASSQIPSRFEDLARKSLDLQQQAQPTLCERKAPARTPANVQLLGSSSKAHAIPARQEVEVSTIAYASEALHLAVHPTMFNAAQIRHTASGGMPQSVCGAGVLQSQVMGRNETIPEPPVITMQPQSGVGGTSNSVHRTGAMTTIQHRIRPTTVSMTPVRRLPIAPLPDETLLAPGFETAAVRCSQSMFGSYVGGLSCASQEALITRPSKTPRCKPSGEQPYCHPPAVAPYHSLSAPASAPLQSSMRVEASPLREASLRAVGATKLRTDESLVDSTNRAAHSKKTPTFSAAEPSRSRLDLINHAASAPLLCTKTQPCFSSATSYRVHAAEPTATRPLVYRRELGASSLPAATVASPPAYTSSSSASFQRNMLDWSCGGLSKSASTHGKTVLLTSAVDKWLSSS